MIHSSLGNSTRANADLLDARKLITESAGNDAVGGSSVPPYWFDWVIADLLVREAEQELDDNG